MKINKNVLILFIALIISAAIYFVYLNGDIQGINGKINEVFSRENNTKDPIIIDGNLDNTNNASETNKSSQVNDQKRIRR